MFILTVIVRNGTDGFTHGKIDSASFSTLLDENNEAIEKAALVNYVCLRRRINVKCG